VNTGWDQRLEEQGLRVLRENRVRKGRLAKVCRICEKTKGIRRCGRNRGDGGRVPGKKQIQREASDEDKGNRVSWEESWRAGVSGGGPGCERLQLKDLGRTAAWERGL